MDTPAVELPKYQCHKIVRAAKITRMVENDREHSLDMRLEGIEGYVSLSLNWGRKHQPQVGGYYVAYEDGYTSYSPAAAFDAGYAPLVETKTYADGTTATVTAPLPEKSPTAGQFTEQRLIALGKTAPRVTPNDLQANIADTEIVVYVTKGGQILRWAILTTKSGFAVVGRPSASVSAENDVPAIGEETAIANSTQELWPLMGYELKCRLAGPTDDMVNRFLQWPVPAHVWPDGTPGEPGRTGTNLLDAPTAQAMLAHVLTN